MFRFLGGGQPWEAMVSSVKSCFLFWRFSVSRHLKLILHPPVTCRGTGGLNAILGSGYGP